MSAKLGEGNKHRRDPYGPRTGETADDSEPAQEDANAEQVDNGHELGSNARTILVAVLQDELENAESICTAFQLDPKLIAPVDPARLAELATAIREARDLALGL